MKKIVAFILSASMCLSLLTVLTPAFAYDQSCEQAVQMMRTVDPDEKPVWLPLEDQGENN